MARAGARGLDFGWRRWEGRHCYNPSTGCDPAGVTAPVAEYPHPTGCAIIGGVVYRGAAIPALRGGYLFSDYCSGTLWAIDAGSTRRRRRSRCRDGIPDQLDRDAARTARSTSPTSAGRRRCCAAESPAGRASDGRDAARAPTRAWPPMTGALSRPGRPVEAATAGGTGRDRAGSRPRSRPHQQRDDLRLRRVAEQRPQELPDDQGDAVRVPRRWPRAAGRARCRTPWRCRP